MCSTMAIFIGFIYSPGIYPVSAVFKFKRFLTDKNSFMFKVRLQNLPIKSFGFSQSGHVSFSTMLPASGVCTLWKHRSRKVYVATTLHHSHIVLLMMLISDATTTKTHQSSPVRVVMILSVGIYFWFAHSRLIHGLHLK